MKKLIASLAVALVSAISVPSFGADWLYQLEQTERFQKKAAEKRAAKERESHAARPATRDSTDSLKPHRIQPLP